MAKSLFEKLLLKPGSRVLLLESPVGFRSMLSALPGLTVSDDPSGMHDVAICFVGSQADVGRLAPLAIDALRAEGVLWLCYPKGSSGVATDISRDRGWEVVKVLGFDAVAQVAVDATWTATRFRPVSDIRRKSPSAGNGGGRAGGEHEAGTAHPEST